MLTACWCHPAGLQAGAVGRVAWATLAIRPPAQPPPLELCILTARAPKPGLAAR